MEPLSGCAYSLLLSCPHGISRPQVTVDFSPSNDRVPHPNPGLEGSVNEIWNQRVMGNPSLYNGLKFRYAGCTLQKDASGQVASVCFHLGLTDYRSFIGTNINPVWEKFLVPSEDDPERCKHTSSPLGNGAVVETTDGKIIVLQRSHTVGEFPGYYVFPGGHSEPQEIGISSGDTAEFSTDIGQLNNAIANEMFEGITREVVEETGVPVSALADPIFIGVSRRLLNVRPTAFFFVKCHMDSERIQRLYKTAQDGYESTQLHAVARDDIFHFASKMPGCHRGGYALYELMLEASI